MKSLRRLPLLLAAGLASQAAVAAGLFNIPRFVTPKDFAIGLEPEITLTSGGGVGVNFRYIHGVTDLINATAILGTASGARSFRVGANAIFDVFPDIQGQPGIGVATQAMYYRIEPRGQMELSAIPYVHKSFALKTGDELEPFLGVPFGLVLSNGRYGYLSSLSVGTMFKYQGTAKFRYIVEVAAGLNNTDTSISGGLIYYH
jgi:hypothetical protein